MATTETSPSPPTRSCCRILALYRFVPLVTTETNSTPSISTRDAPDLDADLAMATPERHPVLLELKRQLESKMRHHSVRGTLLIAPEGINGTICYPFPQPNDDKICNGNFDEDIEDVAFVEGDPVATFLKSHPLFGGPDLRTRFSVWNTSPPSESTVAAVENHIKAKYSHPQISSPQPAFHRLKIKIKPEIVTMGLGRKLPSHHYQNRDSTHTSNEREDHHNENRHESNQKCNPLYARGTYVSPAEWDDLCRNPDVLVIDTRNTYEVEIGTFESAVNPQTESFAEFPGWLERLASDYSWENTSEVLESKDVKTDDAEKAGEKEKLVEAITKEREKDRNYGTVETHCEGKISVSESRGGRSSHANKVAQQKEKTSPKAIAMFCTGGIRCEKATSYALQSNLFPKHVPVYHLEGGILAYLDFVESRKHDFGHACNGNIKIDTLDNPLKCSLTSDTSPAPSYPNCENRLSSTFRGECFVFDKRVAVTEGLKPTQKYVSCYGCRGPMDRRLLQPKEGESDIIDNGCNETDGDEINRLRLDPVTNREYLFGLTCPRCHASRSRESLDRFAARSKQMTIAAREGKPHFRDSKENGVTTKSQ